MTKLTHTLYSWSTAVTPIPKFWDDEEEEEGEKEGGIFRVGAKNMSTL